MAKGTLFNRVKNKIKGQKSSFCSRATSLSLLTEGMVDIDTITYIDCNGVTGVTDSDIINNNGGYIPDCVRGGSPITSSKGYKYFVQYGTTDCNTINTILYPCGGIGQGIIVNTTGYNLSRGGVYSMTLNPITPGPIPRVQCYTIGEPTDLESLYIISGEVIDIGDCARCRR